MAQSSEPEKQRTLLQRTLDFEVATPIAVGATTTVLNAAGGMAKDQAGFEILTRGIVGADIGVGMYGSMSGDWRRTLVLGLASLLPDLYLLTNNPDNIGPHFIAKAASIGIGAGIGYAVKYFSKDE